MSKYNVSITMDKNKDCATVQCSTLGSFLELGCYLNTQDENDEDVIHYTTHDGDRNFYVVNDDIEKLKDILTGFGMSYKVQKIA